jgi:hypothetical protein
VTSQLQRNKAAGEAPKIKKASPELTFPQVLFLFNPSAVSALL